MFWKDWAGYYAVRSFDTYPEREYYAVRHAAGLIDVTPLYKYDVRGPDAGEFLSRIMVRDVAGRFPVGRVAYLCWCDDAGKVMDDGTVSRLEGDAYRVTAAEPALSWLMEHAGPYDVTIEDTSRLLAALALQGPRSRDILRSASGVDLDGLRFFRLTRGTIGKAEVVVSRTGYTGDLGYEIWVHRDRALDVWDAVMEAGRPHNLIPFGQIALIVSRIEAGLILIGVDYESSRHAWTAAQRSTPLELGYGWMFRDLETDDRAFIGRRAIAGEAGEGTSRWRLVGLEIDWRAWNEVHFAAGLIPPKDHTPIQEQMMLYDEHDKRVGYSTSFVYSPILQRHIAIARVRPALAEQGSVVRLEYTVNHEYELIPATVTRMPFFNPERKTA